MIWEVIVIWVLATVSTTVGFILGAGMTNGARTDREMEAKELKETLETIYGVKDNE